MTLNTEGRRAKIPGVTSALQSTSEPADDFVPDPPSEPEEDGEPAATGDGGDPYPVPGGA